MPLFDRFRSDRKRFVSPDDFERNLRRQLAMTPDTLAQLRALGVTPDSSLKLEFFFYTDTADKAIALATPLAEFRYAVEQGLSATDKNLWIVTGWTTPIRMTDEIVLAWTEQMCRLGFLHDCDFDGWGTRPG